MVLVVLALLSTMILTGAQRNLEAQWSSVEHMQDKYQAQAEIEKIVGSLEGLTDGSGTVTLENKVDEKQSLQIVVQQEMYEIQITSAYGKVQIDCTLLLECSGMGKDGDNYTISALNGIAYTAYEISTIGGGGT